MLHFRFDMPLHLMALYGSIMIVVVLMLRFLLKNKIPKFVFPVLWSLVLLRLLVPFSVSSPISAPVPQWDLQPADNSAVYMSALDSAAPPLSLTSGTAETTSYSLVESTNYFSLDWWLVLSVIWGSGIVVTAAVLLRQKLQYTRRLKNSLLIEHNATINSILKNMGMEHILVFTNDQIASPLVCGTLKPRIYLPSGLDYRQTELLRHILIHELMHVKRKDNWLKNVMILALCLNWYNPLVWLMSKRLASDLETACDDAVLRHIDADERKSYASSLLAMAISGSRSTLLYSAFSKTEVERRIRQVLSYKKATAFVFTLSVLFVLSSTIVFATGGQAPFSEFLSSYCSSTSSNWSVKANLTRDIALGDNAVERADQAIFNVLKTDSSNDPDIITNQVREALAKEFKVEKGAFHLTVSLSLLDEVILKEYKEQGITKAADGFYLYNGKAIRNFEDSMLYSMQTRSTGTMDIAINRDRLGKITSITVLKEGDREFDQRTKHTYVDYSLSQDASNINDQEAAIQLDAGSLR